MGSNDVSEVEWGFLPGGLRYMWICSLMMASHGVEVGAFGLLGPRGTLNLRNGHKYIEDVHRAPRSSSHGWQISLKSPRLPSFCDSVSFFFFCCWHSLCAETCIFASSPLHCIMNASLSHAWKHMWQDGLFSSRCARFLSTCRGLRGGRGHGEEGWWDGAVEQRRGGLSLNRVLWTSAES